MKCPQTKFHARTMRVSQVISSLRAGLQYIRTWISA